MFTEGIHGFLLYGNDLECLLLNSAVNYAEQGLQIWFISPEPIKEIPDNIKIPDKEVLKLITFLYLKDDCDLLNHINEIHGWHRIPNVIILHKFNHYIQSNAKHKSFGSFIIANLLDALGTSILKNKLDGYLIIACDEINENVVQLQRIIDLFNLKVFNTKNSDSDIILNNLNCQ